MDTQSRTEEIDLKKVQELLDREFRIEFFDNTPLLSYQVFLWEEPLNHTIPEVVYRYSFRYHEVTVDTDLGTLKILQNLIEERSLINRKIFHTFKQILMGEAKAHE